MSFFGAVRLYSLAELCVFTALVIVALSGASESAEMALGWTHGVGWIILCLVVAWGCMRRELPYTVLAATVSPLGPLGSTIGLEWVARRRRRAPQPG